MQIFSAHSNHSVGCLRMLRMFRKIPCDVNVITIYIHLYPFQSISIWVSIENQWKSIDFQLIFAWFSIDFRWIFNWVSIEFHLICIWVSIDYLLISIELQLSFNWFSLDFQLIFTRVSVDFRLILFLLFHYAYAISNPFFGDLYMI